MKTIETLRAELAGKKTYFLLAIAAAISIGQFLFGANVGVEALPPVDNMIDLGSQLWNFALLGAFRAGIK